MITSSIEDPYTGRCVVNSVGTHFVVKFQEPILDSGTSVATRSQYNDDSGVRGVELQTKAPPAKFMNTFSIEGSIGPSTIVQSHAEKPDGALYAVYNTLSSYLKQVPRPDNSVNETLKPLSMTSYVVQLQCRSLSHQGIHPAYIKSDDELAVWRSLRLDHHERLAEVYVCKLQKLHYSIIDTFLEVPITLGKSDIKAVDSFLRHSIPINNIGLQPVHGNMPQLQPPCKAQEGIARSIFSASFCDYICSHYVGTRSLLWFVLLLISYDLHRLSLCVMDGTRTIPSGLLAAWLDDLNERWMSRVLVDGPLSALMRQFSRVRYVLCLFHVLQAWTRKFNELAKHMRLDQLAEAGVHTEKTSGAAPSPSAAAAAADATSEPAADEESPVAPADAPSAPAADAVASAADTETTLVRWHTTHPTPAVVASNMNPWKGTTLTQFAAELKEAKVMDAQLREKIIALVSLQSSDVLYSPTTDSLDERLADLWFSMSSLWPSAEVYLKNGTFSLEEKLLACIVYRGRPISAQGTSGSESLNRFVRDTLYNYTRVKDVGVVCERGVGNPLDPAATEACLSNQLHRRNVFQSQKRGSTDACWRKLKKTDKAGWMYASVLSGINGASVIVRPDQLPCDQQLTVTFKGTAKLYEDYRKSNQRCDDEPEDLEEVASLVDVTVPKLEIDECPSPSALLVLKARRDMFTRDMAIRATEHTFRVDLARGKCSCRKPACAIHLCALLYARKILNWPTTQADDDFDSIFDHAFSTATKLLDWRARHGSSVPLLHVRQLLLKKPQRMAMQPGKSWKGKRTVDTAGGSKMGHVHHVVPRSQQQLEQTIADTARAPGESKRRETRVNLHRQNDKIDSTIIGKRMRSNSPSTKTHMDRGHTTTLCRGDQEQPHSHKSPAGVPISSGSATVSRKRRRSAPAAMLAMAAAAVDASSVATKPTRIIAIDFETTALWRAHGRAIVEFAAVDTESAAVFCTRVKPSFSICAAATRIHGITNADVSTEQPFPAVWEAFQVWIQDTVPPGTDIALVSFNGFDFDFQVLYDDCSSFGLTIPPLWVYGDLLRHVRNNKGFARLPDAFYPADKDPRENTLQNVYTRVFKREFKGSHSAKGDALALAELYRHAIADGSGFLLKLRSFSSQFSKQVKAPTASAIGIVGVGSLDQDDDLSNALPCDSGEFSFCMVL